MESAGQWRASRSFFPGKSEERAYTSRPVLRSRSPVSKGLERAFFSARGSPERVSSWQSIKERSSRFMTPISFKLWCSFPWLACKTIPCVCSPSLSHIFSHIFRVFQRARPPTSFISEIPFGASIRRSRMNILWSGMSMRSVSLASPIPSQGGQIATRGSRRSTIAFSWCPPKQSAPHAKSLPSTNGSTPDAEPGRASGVGGGGGAGRKRRMPGRAPGAQIRGRATEWARVAARAPKDIYAHSPWRIILMVHTGSQLGGAQELILKILHEDYVLG